MEPGQKLELQKLDFSSLFIVTLHALKTIINTKRIELYLHISTITLDLLCYIACVDNISKEFSKEVLVL